MIERIKQLQDNSKLGRLLVSRGWVSQSQLDQALTYQSHKGLRLGEALIELQFISQKQLDSILCRQRWVRSLVAGIVMVATPICPVLASEKSSNVAASKIHSVATQQSDELGSVLVDAANVSHSNITSVILNNTAPSVSIGRVSWQNDQFANPFMPKMGETGDGFKTVALSNQISSEDFTLGIKHQFSNSSGIEIAVSGNTDNISALNFASFSPQISVYTSNHDTATKVTNENYSTAKVSQRSDRYKNTIPAVYRLTLKGYSVFEQTENTTRTFAFNKVIGSPYKSYELMFSVTKSF